ncbi:hypothetical protein H5410_058132 [Solanum commersonii]|uniref:F-box domain-containing protein n=1 Tax=Solanum commersonii TaxID=4109 RepID=A0A9J5WSR9_SOLCO|nr:hypothetical protein H5410_058132 [Solanum commersonii]
MDYLPVEVVGHILSHLGAARDVIVASATCRKWREACQKHLHTLSFNSHDWPLYPDLSTSRLEILITQTLFQTTHLQGLSILMDDVDEFSASTVVAWLMYTRESLQWLFYNVRTNPNINILDICGQQKLEMLVLAHNSVSGVEPNYQRSETNINVVYWAQSTISEAGRKAMFTPGTHVTAASFSSFIQPSVYGSNLSTFSRRGILA